MNRLIQLRSSYTFKTNSESKDLFRRWRSFDLGSSFLSAVGLCFGLLEYENTFSNSRTYKNCEIHSIDSNIWRFLISFSSFLAIVCLALRYHHKVKWKKKVYFKNKEKDYIASRDKNFRFFLVEVFILCLIPYPYLDLKLYVPVRYRFENLSVCYNLSEVLYTLMFFRVFFILRAFINYSSFQNLKARDLCRDYKIKSNLRFLMKCVLLRYPIVFISFLFLTWLLVFSITIRVYERPLDDITPFFFDNPATAFWFMVENMSTLCYGDLFATAYPSRVICVISYLIGAVIFALMILSMQKNMDLNIHQARAFNSISKGAYAVRVIKNGIDYFILKKKYSQFIKHEKVEKKYEELLRSVKEFKKIRNKYLTHSQGLHELRQGIRMVGLQIGMIDKLVSKTISDVYKNRSDKGDGEFLGSINRKRSRTLI